MDGGSERDAAAISWRLALGFAALAGSVLLVGDALAGGAPPDDAPDGSPGAPVPVADGVWSVGDTLSGFAGRIPLRMTAIRLPDGGLLLHSPVRFSPALRDALEREGPIRHLAAPSSAHWMFLPDWQRACPDAVTWGAPNLGRRRPVRRSGLRIDRFLFDGTPLDWGNALDLVTVPGVLGFREVAFFHRPSRTLVLTDLMMDLDGRRLLPPLRPLVLVAGMTAPDRMPPPYLRLAILLGGEDARHAAHRIVALSPERILLAHGPAVTAEAPEALRRSLRWLAR